MSCDRRLIKSRVAKYRTDVMSTLQHAAKVIKQRKQSKPKHLLVYLTKPTFTSDILQIIRAIKGKGKNLDTCYSATYMSLTRDQQRFTISEVAADWHEPMVPQRIMWLAIHCPR